jgi:hypothetical protein
VDLDEEEGGDGVRAPPAFDGADRVDRDLDGDGFDARYLHQNSD